MCCTRLTGNAGHKNLPSWHNCSLCWAISPQLRHVLTVRKTLLKQQYFPSCPHNMMNFGPPMAEICWRVWATPANFNGFRVLALLLQWRHSTEVNQTSHRCLAISWTGTLYIHFPVLLPHNGILPRAKFTLLPTHVFCNIGSITAPHSSSGHQQNFVTSYKEWNYGTFAEGAIYIRLGGHHVGHWPTL